MKKLFAILIGLMGTLAAWAQTSIRVEVHNIVELSERFNLVFVVEGEQAPSDFQWTAGEDVTVVWGPQKGSSRNVQIVNGKTTRSSQTFYTYILQARKTGTLTIPSAVAKVKGEELRSKPVTIQVVDDGGSSAAGSTASQEPSQAGGQQQARQATSNQGDIFLRLSLSRTSVVVGEPITATLKIYNRTNLVDFENARFPTFNGFWSQEVDSPTNIEFKREQVDGTMYNSAILRRWVIIPQKAGDQTIDPAEIVCLVNVQQRRSTGSIFDDFFNSDFVTTRQRVSTKPATVHVSALPGGAPASFGGGVGEFQVQARLSKDSLKTHDAASLIVTVSGKGNVALLEAPKLSFPPDFEVYDVKTNVNTDKSGTSGSKTFEFPFIPRSPGNFEIGPVQYSYYDVKQRKYHTASTAVLPLAVARSASSASGAPQQGNTLVVDRKGVKNLGEDIRFIRTKTSLGTDKGFFVYSPLWWSAILALLAIGAGIWLGFRKMAARRADVTGNRNRRATRQALKRLAQAKDFLDKNLYTAFYEELHRSLIGFVGDKLAMDMADQNKENIEASLIAGGVPEAIAKDFTELLDACEYARYSPDSGHEAMNAHYEKAVSTITAIDSSMKKPSSKAPVLAILLLLALPLSQARAAESYPDSLWNAGVAAYTEGDFASALQDWEDVRATGLMSKELYYNLGNAYFKTGEMAQSILWYERALKLDPSDADIRHNLEYARSLTQDRIEEVPEIFFEQWGHAMCYLLPSNTWAVLCLVFLAAAIAMALLFLLGSTAGRRRVGFFVGIACLLLAFLGWDFAQWQRQEALAQDRAIVMRPVSSVKSSPSAESAKDLFILHEGTRVKILDNVGSYTNIELGDGRQGWIPSGDIEVI
ncbi:MAG: tetratricopeptide repeat protein [Bacteroidales bacterium]|nr:tetratricopeptide repeat protein [Bacteroidales bacterium]